MMFRSPTGSSSIAPRSLRPLRACAILVAAGLLPLACSDEVSTAPSETGAVATITNPAVIAATPISIEPLTGRYAFTDDLAMQLRLKLDGRATNVINVSDPSYATTLKITVQPGARFPWHTHPGPVIVTVAEGTLTIMYADDCVAREYTGAMFLDPGNSVHTAWNPNDVGETVLYATFFNAPASGALTIPVADQDAPTAKCAALSAVQAR